LAALAVPTNVSRPSDNWLCTKVAFAYCKASQHSSSVASLLPNNRLSLIDPIISTGSWLTYPIRSLRSPRSQSLMFYPSNLIEPPS
jgi:hypothetical protein